MNPHQKLAIKKAALKQEISHSHEKLNLYFKLLESHLTPEAILSSLAQKAFASGNLGDFRDSVEE